MLRGFALIVVLALLGAMSPLEPPSPSRGEARQPEQSHPQPAAQQPATDQRGTDEVPLTVKVLPPEKSPDERAREQRERDEKASHERWLTNWTGVLAIFTVLLAVVAGIQAGFFWVQLKLMRVGVDDAKKAAEAAGESAQATKASVELARETAERQLRAYVTVRAEHLRVQGEDSEKFVLELRIENTGQTPANEIGIKSLVRIEKHPLPATFDFSVPDDSFDEPSVIILGPGGRSFHHSGAEGPFSEADMKEVKRAKSGRRIYCWGTIRYEDAFGAEQTTEFCYFLNWETKPDGGDRIAVQVGRYHNKAT